MERGVKTFIVAAACLVGATAAGCSAGGPGDDPTSPAPPTSTASSPSVGSASPTGRTDLTITYRSAPDATTQTWTLSCHPTGGTVADPGKACDALAENGEAMAATPAGKVCSQVFGGTDVATVSGTWGGIAYHGRFSRQNGCEISRWDALVGLLPAAGSR